jgi:serine/threonine-protein kinase RsbW
MPPKPFTASYTLQSDLSEVRRIQDEIEAGLINYKFSDSDLFAVKLAVEEALVNAIKHGNQLDPGKQVELKYTITPESFEIRIRDEGHGFDPDDLPDPTSDDYRERPCGRGVMLIRSFMTKVSYLGDGNEVIMFKAKSDGDTTQFGVDD